MNLYVLLAVVSVFLNFIHAAPGVDISNDELLDGKYLCEDLPALRELCNGNSVSLRQTGLPNDDLSTSPLFNEFYKLFQRNVNIFLSKNKSPESLQERFSRTVSKRGLDSIGGGHLIKRTQSRQFLSD
uniref:Orcokinin, isoform B n=1 Tax=Drosophila melanogaster TaxID=7227 RepID=A0A0B4LHE6_DROME|nr:orcokinin, isoform B [Drosophila melanogaster]NP_001286799.1 orcokinin, isoform C [Drosophila melanogaster]AGB93690.1 orcokinin, isoform B [Drosophila melanogaster]AHN56594.1 orcokinin, isoform C [Drosophila melanogaster]|eukprot:NP_001261160.1 orcokinin, isoform B [Drosophila melanogaster]